PCTRPRSIPPVCSGTRAARYSAPAPAVTGRAFSATKPSWSRLTHLERDLHDGLAPVQVEDRLVRVRGRKVERQRLHERSRLRLQRHAEGVLRRPGIRNVEDVRRLAEDQRPLGGPGDRPEAVLPGGERLPG